MMKSYTNRILLSLTLFLISFATFAQTKITGTITDAATKETLAGVSIMVKGKVIGTITDVKGIFNLTTSTPTPFKLVITSVGYESQEADITSANSNINIVMKEQSIMGQEVVIAASRIEEKVMKSAASVEKLDIRAIQNTPAASFYDALSNMKGVDMATQGLLFKSINLRGFGSTGNPRTVQMIDGMDNQAPGLNFPTDNIVGIPELDVESVEVLPGAASALYGPNAINGLILMNSKSPFLYQGLSASVRGGVMSASNRPTANTPFGDVSIRYAKAFNNKFAFKTNVSYITAQDWSGSNYDNLNLSGNINPEQRSGAITDYDGVNVYGDEVQSGMRSVANSLIAAKLLPAAALGLVPDKTISRTGFLERDLLDPTTKSFKFNGAMHYRITEKVEAIAQLNYGLGSTSYTGTGRYALREFTLAQAKLELKGDNFTIRGYTTQENSGKSYTAGLSAVQMLDNIKPHETWFGTYVGAFVQARSGGLAEDAAHTAARAAANVGMPTPGTPAFTTLLDTYRNKTIDGRKGGGAFADKSNLYHIEGVYNLKNQIKFVDLLIGANYRVYNLASEATLFADGAAAGRDGSISIGEYGAFVQAAKSLFNDHFKLVGSLRYDKNQNFEGQFTPRISGVLSLGEHNFRVSYQTGFRIPTTQNQYIDLLTPAARLIGGLQEFTDRYKLANSYRREDVAALGGKIVATAGLPETRTQATALITGQVVQGVTAAVNTPATLGLIKAGVTAAVTAAIKNQVVAGVTAAIKTKVTEAVTAGITAKVTEAVTAGITAKVTEAVTAGITAKVTEAVTIGITAKVTEAVTAGITAKVTETVEAQVLQAIGAGIIENTAEAKAAAIASGVAANLPAALTANLSAGVAANLPAALTANLEQGVAANLPAALAANLEPTVAANLPAALAANLEPTVAANLPAALAANLEPTVAANLPAALEANLEGGVAATLPGALAANLDTKVAENLPGAIKSTIESEVAKALPGALAGNLATVIQGLAVNANIGSLKPAVIKPIQPERIASYEFGYKSLIGKKLFVDAYYYLSQYNNFIGGVVLIQPTASIAPGVLPEASGVLGGGTRNVYSRTANSSKPINVTGWGLGLNYSLGQGYSIGGNVANNELKNFEPTPEVTYSGFNTPKYRMNLNIGKRITSDSKYGFGIAYKHQNEFLWQAGFVQPTTTGVPLFTSTMVPAISNLDAQFSYKLSKMKTIMKLGATNLGGKPYVQAYGSPSIGSMYYIQLNFDELMN